MLLNSLGKAGIAAFTIFLYGCATLSTEECQRGDWQSIGQADGAAGQSMGRIDEHTRACRRAGVYPDIEAYTAGRVLGLRRFCTYDNGVDQGSTNRTYNRVCTAVSDVAEAEFLDGYEFGQQIYGINRRIAEIDGNIRDTRELLYAKKPEDKERYQLERILEGLENQRADLRVEVRLLRQQGRVARVQ